MGEVTALLQDSTGILWIGTGDHGLIRMKGDQLTAIPPAPVSAAAVFSRWSTTTAASFG